MTDKRLIVRDYDYAWVDTITGNVIEIEDAFDLVNNLHEENEQLKKEIEEKEEVIKFYHRFNRGVDDDL